MMTSSGITKSEETEIQLNKLPINDLVFLTIDSNPIKKTKKFIFKKIKKCSISDINNTSPLRYPGGKTRARKKLDEILSKYFKLDSYNLIISPFFGGGSFEFYLQNKYHKKLQVNDKFAPLYNFWSQVKLNKKIMCSELTKNIEVSKDNFTEYRNSILNLENDPLKQAIYYFIINRCSFSGATLSGGFSQEASKKRFTQSSIQRINNLNLTYVEFFNMDFEEFIINYYNDKTLMFLDPPYYLGAKSNLYGNSGDMHETFDHDRLFKTLINKKNWIMTYNNCEYIKNMYKDYIILETSWSYGMNKSKKSSEIVIIKV